METFRVFVVHAEDNSNIRIQDFEAEHLDDARKVVEGHLEDGEAVDQVVHITPESGPAEPSEADLQAQIARLEAQLEEMQRAQEAAQ